MRKIEKIIIHCTATPPSMDIDIKEVRRWHIGRGYTDIAYHFLICRNGTVQEGRDISVVGAHTKGVNRYSIGVCYIGGVDEDFKPQNNLTEKQKSSLIKLIRKLKQQYPSATIHGHNEFANKACPSFDVKRLNL